MSRLIITINTANAAFEEGSGTECARILNEIACDIDGHDIPKGTDRKLFDINGNKVGYYRYE